MKKIFTYLVAVSALLLSFSCNREAVDHFVNGEGISLKLVWSDMTLHTRVTGENNENLVKSLDFYFFKDATATSVYHYRETTIPAEDNYTKDFVPGEKYDGTNAFPKRTELVNTDGCTVFVVANLDEAKAPASATLATLKAIQLDETFLDDTGKASLATDDDDLYFVMTGTAKVQGTRKVLTSTLEPETIELSRLAAKITVDITAVSTSKTVDGITETWTPMLRGENVRVYPQNAVSNAVLGAVDGGMPATPAFFDFDMVTLPNEVAGTWTEDPAGTFVTEGVGHFYTYPNNWEEGGTDTFLKIVLPWQVVKTQGGNVIYSAQREVYYKVILTEKEILSNNWYNLAVTLEPGKEGEYEVEIPATYEVVDWTTGGQNGVNSTLKDILYLVVDYSNATGYDLDGDGDIDDDEAKIFVIYGEEASVPYSASNDVGYKVLNAYYTEFNNNDFTATTKYIVQNGNYRYTDVGAGNGKRVGYPGDDGWTVLSGINTVNSWFSVGDAEGSLTLDHTMNNDYKTDFFDLSPYVFTVQVYLVRAEDNPKYQKEVTFVQFPQTYLDLDLSPEKGRGTGNYSNYRYGYVYVNDHTRTSTGQGNTGDGATRWYNITIIGNVANNSNPNMYVLTTGVLSSSELKLGDPRTSVADNGPKYTNNTQAYSTYPGNATRAIDGDGVAVSFVSAPHVSKSGNVTLTNYHPADIAKSESFIAPKLRVQSGYGRRGSNSSSGNNRFDYTWGSAWNRCAAYQEAGYPAGRWRLPTVAEIEYINTLSQQHFIPSLFYGTNYWSASPGVAYNQGERVDNHFQGSTRCVYDDWYWGSDPVWDATTDDTFKWGD